MLLLIRRADSPDKNFYNYIFHLYRQLERAKLFTENDCYPSK